MSTLTIRKKSLKTWLHIDSSLGDFIISKFYFNADGLNFQIVEQGQSKRVIYNISDITLYDDTVSGSAETFGSIAALSMRLEVLNYPAFFSDGQTPIPALDDLTNVNITTPTDGQILAYDFDTGKWINIDNSGGTTPTLQEVTDVGNETTNVITINSSGGDNMIFDEGTGSINQGGGVFGTQYESNGGGGEDYSILNAKGVTIINDVDSDETNYRKDSIIVNGVSYLLPSGTSSQIATLLSVALKQDKTTATTGSVISFATPQVYNSIASPSSSNITDDLTGAIIGVVQKIYHNHSVAPTVPAGWVRRGDGEYVVSTLNIIFAEWSTGTTVEYWINQ